MNLTQNEKFKVVSVFGTPELDFDKYILKVEGLVKNELALKYSDLLSYPSISKVVDLNCVEGWRDIGNWTGILLKNILEKSIISHDATTVVFYSADGYSTSLSVADSLKEDVILSYKLNDKILSKEHGYPLRLVVGGKYGYKWIKWITHINVIKGDYKGYWESYGYCNKADVGGPIKIKLYKLSRMRKKIFATLKLNKIK